MEQAASPVYGEKNVTLQYRVCDLLWRPVGRLVRFVVVIYPTRGRCLLMSTDTSLSAIEIIRLYGLRFKIEHGFKQAVRVIGALLLPLLDEEDETVTSTKRQPIPSSGILGLPRCRQTQDQRLSCLYSRGRCLPGTCFSIWPPTFPSWCGPLSVPGCERFALALPLLSWLWLPHYATRCLNFS